MEILSNELYHQIFTDLLSIWSICCFVEETKTGKMVFSCFLPIVRRGPVLNILKPLLRMHILPVVVARRGGSRNLLMHRDVAA